MESGRSDVILILGAGGYPAGEEVLLYLWPHDMMGVHSSRFAAAVGRFRCRL